MYAGPSVVCPTALIRTTLNCSPANLSYEIQSDPNCSQPLQKSFTYNSEIQCKNSQRKVKTQNSLEKSFSS